MVYSGTSCFSTGFAFSALLTSRRGLFWWLPQVQLALPLGALARPGHQMISPHFAPSQFMTVCMQSIHDCFENCQYVSIFYNNFTPRWSHAGLVQKFSRKLHSLQSLWEKCDSPEPVDLGRFRANHLKSRKILYTYCIFFVLLFIVCVHITRKTPKLIPFFHMFFSCQGHATGTGPPRHSDPIGCPGSAGRAAAGSSAAPPLLGCLQLDEWCKNPLFNGLV